MKLASISVHLAVDKGFLSNHGIYGCNHQDLKSKSDHLFASSVHGYPSSTHTLGYKPVQLQLRSKESLNKYLKTFAKIQGNDDIESSSWGTRDEVTSSFNQKSESIISSEDLSTSPSISNSQLEEDSECQSVHGEDLSGYQLDFQVCLDKLRAVLLHVLASGQWNSSRLKKCHRNYLVSATNLIHYLALHSLDIQQLTDELSSIGLLNLECSTLHVLASITSCIQLLEKQSPNSYSAGLDRWDASVREYMTNEKAKEFSISAMRARASMHAIALLGTVRDKKKVHIMVTIGKEAAAKQTFLPDLLKAGANILRINCAHDDSGIWGEIITQARHNSQKLEKPCRILMDLAGPKLRTTLLNKGPNVLKISPKKDAKGDVIVPGQIWLSLSGCGPPSHISPDAVLYVESERFLDKLEVGNIIRFVDVRGRKRSLKVSKRYSVFAGYGYVVECTRSAYVESGTSLRIERKKGRNLVSHVVDVPAAEQFIRLRVGDLLTICRDPSLLMGISDDKSCNSPKIACDSGRLFDSVKPGEPIAFDDGKIWGLVQGASNNEIVVSITHASPKGSKLRDGKSINIPESAMQFEGVTSKDLQDLEFVASNADMVGISFIRDTRDINIVMQELAKRKLEELGVVLKIETRSAFEKLPLLLLEAMHYPNPLGVMIARGDLAVECGWDQMASIQEEILSVCRAAHVPVIWATQVLESLVKSGIPTRAEITDVASGMRANCIMLNKGKYIVQAVSSLDSISSNCPAKEKMRTLLRPLLPSN